MNGTETKGATDFGAELRAWRSARGWTQVELGAEIGYSGSFVSDLERGDRMPSTDFAERCDQTFGTPGSFVRWCDATRRGAFPPWFAPILPYEQDAVHIHGWVLGAVPGLLQTDAYARSVIRVRWPRDSDEAIERRVAARMDRQKILARTNPPLMWYVMDEGILRRLVGSGEVMTSQLDKLIKAAESPGIVLQVLPFGASDHAGVEGPITVYERVDGPAVGYTEFHDGGRVVDNSKDVADLMIVLAILRAVALSPRDSVTLMKRIRGDLDELSQVELQRWVRWRLR